MVESSNRRVAEWWFGRIVVESLKSRIDGVIESLNSLMVISSNSLTYNAGILMQTFGSPCFNTILSNIMAVQFLQGALIAVVGTVLWNIMEQ